MSAYEDLIAKADASFGKNKTQTSSQQAQVQQSSNNASQNNQSAYDMLIARANASFKRDVDMPQASSTPTTSPASDVQTWGSKPESNWVTEKGGNSLFGGTTTLQATKPKQETETDKRIKELQDRIDYIDQNAGYDLTGTYDWSGERKRAEDELRSLGVNVTDRGKLLYGTVEQGAGGVVTSATSFLDELLGAPAQEVHTLLNQTATDLGIGSPDKNLFGDTNYITRLNQWAQNKNKQEQEYYAANASGDKAAEAVNKYGTMVVQAIPAAIMAFGTGGASLATTAGLESIATANSAGNLGYIAEMSGQALRRMASDPQYKLSFIQEAGSAYQNALDDGATEEEAALYSMLYGSTASMIEVGGSDEALGGIQKLPQKVREALAKGEAKPVVSWIKSIFSEAGEEVSQGTFERGLKAVYSDVPIYGRGNANAIINPDQTKEEAIGAAITSAILGGGQVFAVDGAIPNSYNNTEQAKQANTQGKQSRRGRIDALEQAAAAGRSINAQQQVPVSQQIVNDATQPQTEKAPSVADQIVNDAVNGVPPITAQNAAGAQAQQGDITTAQTQQNASMVAPVELNSQSTQNVQQAGEIATDESGFNGKVVDTQNAYADANGMESGTHVQHSDAEVNSRADAMLSEKGADGVMAELANRKDGSTYAWSDVDTRTAQKAMDTVRAEMAKVKETDPERYLELAKKLGDFKDIYEKAGTNIGRSLRQRGIFNNTPADIVAEAARVLTGKEFIAMRNDLTEVGKADLLDTVDKYAAQLETFENKRDTESIIEMIKDLSAQRRTTAFQGKLWGKGEKNLINSMLERAANMPDGAEYLGNLAGQQIKGLVYDQKQAGWINQGKSIRYMWMLSSPKSIMNNISGNSVMGLLVDPASNNIGFLFDSLMSKVTGTREVAFDRGIFSKAAIEGMDEAATKSFLEVALDVDTSASKYTGKSGRTFKMSGNVIERFFSTLEMLQGFAYNTTDAVAKGIAAGETTRGLNQLRESGKTNLNIKEAAEQTAKYRTLQEDNAVTDAMLKARNAADNFIGIGNEKTGRFGVGNAVMPFGKTGANAVKVSAIDLNPLMVGKAALSIKNVLQAKKNGTLTPGMQRTAALQMGRALNGTSLLLLSMSLAAKGVIRWHNDDNKDKNALESALGKEGLQINLSAALRGLIGGDTEERAGDLVTELDFAPELNAYATMGFMLNEARADGKVTAKEFIGADAYAVAVALKEFPSFSQVTRILNAAKYAETDDSMSETEKMAAKVEAGAKTLGSDVLTSFLVPNLARNVASGLDSTERELYTGDIRENTINQVRAAIPGEILGIGRETLPAKLDNWGNAISNEGGFQNFLNKNFLPASLTRIKNDPTSEAILGLAEASGDNSIIPDKKPPKSVTYDGEKHEMSLEEQRAYQKTYGDKYHSIIEDVLGIRSYKGYDAATQAAVMKEAESLAKDTAKGDYLVDSGTAKADDVSTKVDGMKKAEAARYVVAKAGYDSAKRSGNYDLIDEIISGQFSGLSKKTVDALGDNGAEMAKINEAMDNGLSTSGNYFKAQDAMRGNDSNKAVDEIKAMSMILPDRDVDAMAPQKLSEAQLSYYKVLRSADYSPADFSTIYGASLNGSGNITQAALRQALESADKLSYNQKQEIWSIYADSKNWERKKY